MDRDLAEILSAGRARGHRSGAAALAQGAGRDEPARATPTARPLSRWASSSPTASSMSSVARLRRLAAEGAGLKQGRSPRDHAAEHAAVSHRDVRRAARRAGGRQHQPALHRAGTRAPAQRTPAPAAIVVLENFAHVLQQVLPRTKVQHVIVTAVGRFAALSEVADRQLRRAPRAQAGAALEHSRAQSSFKAASRERRAMQLSRRSSSAPRTSPFCSTPAARPASPRARCSSHGNISANVLQAAAWIGRVARRTPPEY